MPSYERLPSIANTQSSPRAVALDDRENLYVTDIRNNRLVMYSQSGKHMNTLNKLDKPTSVAVDSSGQIYVANKGRGNVEVYSPDLVLLYRLGFEDKQFSNPTSIRIDSSGNIYVSDAGDDLVKVYYPDGSFNFSFGGTGSGNGQFYFPTSIAINDAAGEIIVSDLKQPAGYLGSTKARVQIFDMEGVFDRSFGVYGPQEGRLIKPMGVEVDGEGRIFVADAVKSVVVVYDSFGGYLGTLYDLDSPRIPLGLTLGGSNRLFIASFSASRVDVYGLDPFILMDVAPLNLTFEGEQNGPNPDLQTVEIRNNGSGTLNWTSRTDELWIMESPGSGSIGPYSSAYLTVGIGLAGLLPGEYTGSLEIEAESGATEVVDIRLTVAPQRELSVYPSSLNFSTVIDIDPLSKFLSIDNAGGGTLAWTAVADRAWIVLDKSTGTAPDTIEVSIDTASLGVGTFAGEVTITGEYALNSPVAVPVTVDITEVQPLIIAGAGPEKNNTAYVRTFNSDGTGTGTVFVANGYAYGVNVASGDINGDGISDIITAPGPGSKNPAEINIFDRAGNHLEDFTMTAFPYIFGAYVASADFDSDGYYEIITGAGPEMKTPAHVKVFTYDISAQTLVESGIDFLAYDTMYGARVAAGDVDGDGTPELITAPGPGPSNIGIIRVWKIDTSSGKGQWSVSLMREFIVETDYKSSVTIASGDVNGDGADEIITGDGPNQKARDVIRVFDKDGVMISAFEAGVTNGHGANVACGDTDSDGVAEIVVGAGPDPQNRSIVQIFDVSGTEKVRFRALNTIYGVNIAVGQ
jgi:sugar lactone lactonase YvrE